MYEIYERKPIKLIFLAIPKKALPQTARWAISSEPSKLIRS